MAPASKCSSGRVAVKHISWFGALLLEATLHTWTASAQTRPASPFLIMDAAAASQRQIIECPSHTYGTMTEGLAMLKKKLAAKPADQPALAQLCVGSQEESLRLYAPLVDIVAINPFAQSTGDVLTSGPLWEGFDHPLVNRAREIRRLAGETQLLARIDVQATEPGPLRNRPPSFEEVQWLAFAAVGAGYGGLVWVRYKSEPRIDAEIDALSGRLRHYGEDFCEAKPVPWVEGRDQLPVSALASREKLFVVVLNPAYFHDKTDDRYTLPLDPKALECTVAVCPPEGVLVDAAQTLAGRRILLNPRDNAIEARFHLRGGGEILVFSLAQKNRAPSAEGPAR